MAFVWMREVFKRYNDNAYTLAKLSTLFMYRCAGFTFQSENVGASKSFISTEKDGTNGVLTNSDYTFTDSVAASFTAADLNKFIVIKDPTNNSNTGVYEIKKVVNSTTIELEFNACLNEFPTAATSLSWWLAAGNYERPSVTGEYVRLQSPHTSGWAIEFYIATDYVNYLYIKVSLDGTWTGKILGTAYNAVHHLTGTDWKYGSIAANLDGSSLFMFNVSPGTFANDVYAHDVKNMFMVNVLDPVESGISTENLITLFSTTGSYNHRQPFLYDDGNYTGYGRVFTSNGVEVRCSFIDATYNGATNAMILYSGREPNRRIQKERGMFKSPPIFIDFNNDKNAYQILGYLKDAIVIQPFHHGKYCNNADLRQYHPISVNSNKDYLHLDGGLCIPWPGIGPAYP